MLVQDLDGRETAAILYSHALLLESSYSLHEGFYRCEKSPTSSDPVKKMISCEPHFPAQTDTACGHQLQLDTWASSLLLRFPCPSPRLWSNAWSKSLIFLLIHPPTCGLCLLPAVFTSLTPEQVSKADGLWASLVSSGPAFLTATIFYVVLFHHRRQKSQDSEQRLVEELEVGQDEGRGGSGRRGQQEVWGMVWEKQRGSSGETREVTPALTSPAFPSTPSISQES